MSSEQWTATAAVAAVVISLVNVAFSARLVRAQEGERWTREQLPEVVRLFSEASHRWEVKVFEGDWSAVHPDDRESHGMDEAREVLALLGRFEVFASPETIMAAHAVADSIDAIRLHCLTVLNDAHTRVDKPWPLYWQYAEARHSFLAASRREMGLKPPPLPPGLEHHRQSASLGRSSLGRRRAVRGRTTATNADNR